MHLQSHFIPDDNRNIYDEHNGFPVTQLQANEWSGRDISVSVNSKSWQILANMLVKFYFRLQ